MILPVHNERARLEHSLGLVTAFAATHPEHHFAFVADGSVLPRESGASAG